MTLHETLRLKEQELRPFFKPGFLQRNHTVFQFHFLEEEPFYLEVTAANFSISPGTHNAPTLKLLVDDHTTCWNLIQGKADGMKAFMEGQYRADGHIVLSQLLLYLFKANDPTNIHEVRD